MDSVMFRFDEDLASDLRYDYRTMLALGVTEDAALEKVLEEYKPEEYGYSYATTFWLVLAQTQWKLGRLDDEVREHALDALEEMRKSSIIFGSTKRLQRIYEELHSPMPPKKKVRKPTVFRCPWPVGSLVAYRICNNKNFENDPCFGKYILFRIVKIDRKPIIRIIPTDVYDESVRIAVYNWIGDSIPDPKIVETLEFTPIFRGDNLWQYFLWPTRNDKTAELTLLQTPPDYQPPADMNFRAVPYTLTHILSFDASLTRRFRPDVTGK